MSQQQTLHRFFKVKSKSPGTNSTDKTQSISMTVELGSTKKKRSLSLRRTPTPVKSSKTNRNSVVDSAVNLISDDENCKVNTSQDSCSSSNNTVLYSLTPTTPQKSPGTTFQSPSSKNKYYSPNRKRSMFKRSPNVRKNLARDLNSESTSMQSLSTADEVFLKACEGMDDKTIFLLNIINKYLTTASLRPLLDEQAQSLLVQCLEVPKPGMRLVCRLYWRQRGWYMRSQLPISDKKTENVDEAIMNMVLPALVQRGFLVKTDPSGKPIMTFEELTEILKLEDLKKICKDLLKKTLTSKEKIITELRKFCKVTNNMSRFITGCPSDNNTRLLTIMSKQAGECYKLSNLVQDTLHKLYVLMFLGIDYSIIRDKKLELMLLQDKTGAELYPTPKNIEIDNASVVFRNKDEFYKYVTAHEIYESFLDKTQTTDRCAIVKQVYSLYKEISKEDMHNYKALPQWLHRFTPPYIFIKILDKGVQDLKRVKTEADYELALNILDTCIEQSTFRQHKKAEWFGVKALILHTLKRYDEAATTLIEGLSSDISDENRDLLRPRAEKLATQKNIVVSEHLKKELMTFTSKQNILEKNLKAEHINRQPLERVSSSSRGKLSFGVRDESGFTALSAEQYCVKHYTEYIRTFTHGEHWEGRVVTSLFFLLFWDIIYSAPLNCRGIFLTHFQTYPLDMFSDCFYKNRKREIDALLKEIENSSEEVLVDMVYQQWAKRPQTELSGVYYTEWPTLRCVVSCLGGRGLAAICRRLAVNYQYARSGFPDLTLWNITDNTIRFVEVKTDADKPSMKQKQWMHYLTEHGIDTQFCYIGVNTTRCKARAQIPQEPDSGMLNDLETSFDSDFEEKQEYTPKNQPSTSGESTPTKTVKQKVSSPSSKVGVSENSSDAFEDDDVILIPEDYVEIVIDA